MPYLVQLNTRLTLVPAVFQKVHEETMPKRPPLVQKVRNAGICKQCPNGYMVSHGCTYSQQLFSRL